MVRRLTCGDNRTDIVRVRLEKTAWVGLLMRRGRQNCCGVLYKTEVVCVVSMNATQGVLSF